MGLGDWARRRLGYVRVWLARVRRSRRGGGGSW